MSDKNYSNQPRSPQLGAYLNLNQGKKNKKVSGSLYYEGTKTKRERKPNIYVTVK